LLLTSLILLSIAIAGCSGGKPAFDLIDNLQTAEIPADFQTEPALILLEEDRMEIDGGEAIHDYTLVKKILQSGHPEEGEFSFGNSRYRKILFIKAKAVYPDGRERILNAEDIQVLPSFEDFVFYSEHTAHNFRFPGVRAGTIIEVNVRWKIDNLFGWMPANFQGRLPILTRRYILVHPDNMKYRLHAMAMPETPDKKTITDAGNVKLVWERRNIEAFESEDMMPPLTEYLPRLSFFAHEDFEYGMSIKLDSWAKLITWCQDLAEKSLQPGPGIRGLVGELCTPGIPEQETARRLYNWVQENLRYVALYLGLDGYRPHTAESALKTRYGDCKDQSVVLAAALKEAGLKVCLVLVRTSDLGHVSDIFPWPGYFNHMIVAADIDGETVYLDPTCGTCSYGILRYDCQNADALMIREGETGLVRLPAGLPRPNSFDISSRVAITAEGKAKITSRLEFDGYYASRMRGRFARRSGRSKHEIASELFTNKVPGAEVEDIAIEGDDPASDSLSITITHLVPDVLDPNKRNCFLETVFYPVYIDLPGRKDRAFPLLIGKRSSGWYELSMELPEGWRVLEVPDSGEIINHHFEYTYSWGGDERRLEFSRRWTIKDGRIPAADYPGIRDQLKTVMKHERTRVLVSRGSSGPGG
jgi:hypothetical protein